MYYTYTEHLQNIKLDPALLLNKQLHTKETKLGMYEGTSTKF